MKPKTKIASEQQLASAVSEYLEIEVSLQQMQARQAELLSEIKCRHRDECEQLQDTAGELLKAARKYCAKHPEIFPEGKRSVEYGAGEVGFYLHPESVVPADPEDTFEGLANRLAKGSGIAWVQRHWTLDKNLILSKRAIYTDEQWAELGIAFGRKETFYIAPAGGLDEGKIVKQV